MLLINNIFILLTGIFAFILSHRYEYGILNYTIVLNYSIIDIFGLELMRSSLADISNVIFLTENIYHDKLLCLILTLLMYDSLTSFVTNKYIIVLLSRISIVFSFYFNITFADNSNYILVTLSGINILLVLIERLTHINNFRYGTVHKRYCYVIIALYIFAIINISFLYDVKLYYLLFIICIFNLSVIKL